MEDRYGTQPEGHGKEDRKVTVLPTPVRCYSVAEPSEQTKMAITGQSAKKIIITISPPIEKQKRHSNRPTRAAGVL